MSGIGGGIVLRRNFDDIPTDDVDPDESPPFSSVVVSPQALRMTLPPAVGFLVQLVKATAVTSIIYYAELMRTANAINDATFEPFAVHGMLAAICFAL